MYPAVLSCRGGKQLVAILGLPGPRHFLTSLCGTLAPEGAGAPDPTNRVYAVELSQHDTGFRVHPSVRWFSAAVSGRWTLGSVRKQQFAKIGGMHAIFGEVGADLGST